MKSKKGAHKQHSPYRAARQVADDFSMFSFHFNSVTTTEQGKSTFFPPLSLQCIICGFYSILLHQFTENYTATNLTLLTFWRFDSKRDLYFLIGKKKITFIFSLPETRTHLNLTAVEFSMIFLEESSLHTSVNAFSPKYNVRWWMDLPHWPRIS